MADCRDVPGRASPEHGTPLAPSPMAILSQFLLGLRNKTPACWFSGKQKNTKKTPNRTEQSGFQAKKEPRDDKDIHFSYHSPLKRLYQPQVTIFSRDK